MFYIVLNILCSVALLFIFKLFVKFKVNSLQAIIVNYLAATSTGLLFSKNSYDTGHLLNSDWLYISIPLGFLLIAIFYLISLTTQKTSISTASVANKMSVAMPVLFSVLILNEQLSFLKGLGIFFAFIALYLSTASEDKTSSNGKKLFYLPLLVFLGSGLIDVAINATKAFYIHNEQDSEMFTITSFAFAFCVGLILLFYNFFRNQSSEKRAPLIEIKSILAGFILGVPNYFSIFFIIKALESNALKSAQLFPVLNISNVILSTLIGFLIFNEKLSTKNKVGLLIAILAIILITL